MQKAKKYAILIPSIKFEVGMLFYILVILGADVIITLLNIFIPSMSAYGLLWIAINTVVGTVGIIAVDGLGALVVRRLLPKRWFSADVKIFKVSKREQKIYKKLKIKAWKDKVPELGMFTGFSKSRVTSFDDVEYLERFIMEINYGVICHLQNALFGFLILFIPFFGTDACVFPAPLTIWLPIFAVNFVLSLLPVMILRYTSHTLTRLYDKQMKSRAAAADKV